MKIEWHGGEMPVPEGTPIRVWYRDRSREPMTGEAGDRWSNDWTHTLTGSDIVAYEVLGELETDEDSASPLIQWEYALEDVPRGTVKEIRDYLNRYGDDGWELCLADFGHFIFKRRKS